LRGRRSVGRCVGSSDEALLAGLAAGDREAAATFVRRFQHRVYGLALTIVGDPATAEDAAQEAFLRAWRVARTYEARRGRVPTWLLAIAGNVALDLVRPGRPEPLDPEALAARLQAGGGAEGGGGSPLPQRERLRRALGALTEEQSRAVVLAAVF